MRSQAYKVPVSDGHPVEIHDFIVASRWEDLPPKIKERLNQEDLIDNLLLKSIDGNPIFSAPEAGYFVLKVTREDKVRYVSSMFTSPKWKDIEQTKQEQIPPFLYLSLIALVLMALFALVPYLMIRKVANPIEKLMAWTKNLNKEQLMQPIPDFHFSELNSLANIVQSSLRSVQESLDREHRFLGYASHELRTPIAVTRTNTELLRKMIEKDISVGKQLQVLERIERASFNMTDLTETLLWLNRKTDKSIPLISISIGGFTEQLLEELSYLLNGKSVEVKITTDETMLLLPQALCRIVISNLIRNALQHTTEGKICIIQAGSNLIINNREFDSQEINDIPKIEHQLKNELGFGLGLELTERLIQHYDWKYKNVATDDGHYVEIDFS
ncbi:HAMP domain-containing sensor histidine kinase [Psychromonas arctica]|uniref:histidine kinase n=1 Tax=Psychromonas arctica TaxID=168275 RepID=A0ABU9HCF7_9GAMM